MATVVTQRGRDLAPSEVAGPFRLGTELTPVNAAPVKIIKEYLGKRPESGEIVLLKVLQAKKAGVDSEEVRQGKMLLHTEFNILSMLYGMEGICRHHGLFKDSYRVPGAVEEPSAQFEEVERVILALDCYHPHHGSSRESVNLQQHVIRHKKLCEREALRLFHEIVSVVEQMHANNIVHRDLKLGNMVLNLRTKKVTIVNFCLSKHLVPSNEKLTDQRGSLAYVSPDILSGAPYCGKASDCWALGVLLYTMLYGQFPFYDSNPQVLFRKIKSAQYVMPNDGRVSMGTKLLISRLMSLDPNKRLKVDAALEETQRIMSKWHSMVSSEELAPIVPDIDKKSQCNDEMCVPTNPRGNSLSSATSSELTAPRLGIFSATHTSTNNNTVLNNAHHSDVEQDRSSATPNMTTTEARRRVTASSSSVVHRRGANRRNLRLNLRPVATQQPSPAPVVYSYMAIGHTPSSPPPMLVGRPQTSPFVTTTQNPISPGSAPLGYYISSPVSGVPDGSGYFRFQSVTTPSMGTLQQVRGIPGAIAGCKRRRESVETDTITINSTQRQRTNS